MKYIIIQRELTAEKGVVTLCPILFPKDLVHQDVANAILEVLNRAWPSARVEVISAGEANVFCGAAYGFSDTLGVMAGDNDRLLLNNVDYFNFYDKQEVNNIGINNVKENK